VLRVVYADDSWLTRQAIGAVLERCDGVDVVAVCEDGDAVLAAVEAERPHVVLTDLRMPPSGDGEGVRIARALAASHRDVGVLVLSQYADPVFGLALIEDGVEGRGYLLKDRVHHAAVLDGALRAVAHGGSLFDPALVDSLLRRNDAAGGLDELTAREREVLAEMALGKSNATIAQSLVLTKKAVEKHVSAIFAKLGLPGEEVASRRVAAVLRYLEGGGHPR